MPVRMRKALPVLYLPLFFLLFLSARPAASELTLQSEVGFHGIFQLGRPFPLKVDIANSGRAVEGVLEVKVWKGGAAKGGSLYSVHYRRQLLLPSQSRKTVQFTVDPDSLSRPLTLSFSSPRETLSEEIDLRRHYTPSPLILLLTGMSASPPVAIPSVSPRSIVSMSLGDLPTDPRAYQGVWSLILYEQPFRDLSKSQTLALETWLSSGGRMIILGGLHYALYQEPALRRFLPVRVLGLKKFSSLPSLERAYGKPVRFQGTLLVQDSRMVEGRALVEEKGMPIVVETIRGKGRVFYLSADAGRGPLSRWEGLPLLFKDLLGSPPEKEPRAQAAWDEAVFFRLLSGSSLFASPVPVLSFLLGFLCYLGGLGLLAWLRLRRRFPGRTFVAAFLSLVVFSSLSGYLYFDRGGNSPDGLLVSSTLLEALSGGYVDAQSNVALFSTRRKSYSIEMKSGWTDLELVSPVSAKAEKTPVVIHEEGSSTRLGFPLREWDYRLFKLRSVSRFPVHAEIENRGGKLSLKLINQSAKDLTECWLVVAGERFYVGDIQPGATQVREFHLARGGASVGDRAGKRELREVPFTDKGRELLFRHSFFAQEDSWVDGAALFFGWVKGEPARVSVEDSRILARDYTLFRAIIPLALDKEGE